MILVLTLSILVTSLHQRITNSADSLRLTMQYAIALCCFAWLTTHGTWEFLVPELPVTLTAAHDAQGLSLLSGDLSIPPEIIQWEAFNHDGKTYMYFGILPALLRIVPNSLFESLYGCWTRPLTLVAISLWLLCFGVFTEQFTRGFTKLSSNLQKILSTVLFFSLSGGTPLVFLSAVNSIYNEAILWGVAGELVALLCVVKIMENQIHKCSLSSLFIFSVASSFSLLARVTCAIPLAFGILFFTVITVLRASKNKLGRSIFLLVPFTLAVCLQAYVNNSRFGSPLKFADFSQYLHANDLGISMNRDEASLTLKRIPEALRWYFGVSQEQLSKSFPWIHHTNVTHPEENIFYLDYSEFMLPFILLSVTLIAGSAVGLSRLVRRKTKLHDPAILVLPVFFLGQILLITTYFFVTYRYTAEFVPFFLFWWSLPCEQFSTQKWKLPAQLVFVTGWIGLGFWSITMTVMSALGWTLTQWAVPSSFHEVVRAAIAYFSGSLPEWATLPPL